MDGETPPDFVSRSRVKELLSYKDLIPALEEALVNFSDKEGGGIVQPVRTQIRVDKDTMFLSMSAYSKKDRIFATKQISVLKRNAEKGLPSHMAYVTVCDAETGELSAIINGEDITAMRTAAVSAIAAKYMVCEPPSVLCVFGSGTQAASHIEALNCIFTFKEIRVCSRNPVNREKFAKDHNAVPYSSAQEAVQGADVIVTATMSAEPVLFGSWVKKGAFIAAVGACRPDWRELDDELMLGSDVIADSIEGAKTESGDIIHSKAEIVGEIGNVIREKIQLTKGKTRIFKSLGMAIEDVAAAKLVYDKFKGK